MCCRTRGASSGARRLAFWSTSQGYSGPEDDATVPAIRTAAPPAVPDLRRLCRLGAAPHARLAGSGREGVARAGRQRTGAADDQPGHLVAIVGRAAGGDLRPA